MSCTGTPEEKIEGACEFDLQENFKINLSAWNDEQYREQIKKR